MKTKKYAIVKDLYSGYEVRVKKRFLIFTYWKQVPHYMNINTFHSIDSAKEWVINGCKPFDEIVCTLNHPTT